jgi:class 3 adenylate cyclase
MPSRQPQRLWELQPRRRRRLQKGSAVGMDVHLAARVGAAGHGGQIVASDSTKAAVAAGVLGVSFRDLGLYRLKGIPLDVRLYQVDGDQVSPEFPPLRGIPV